jgi:hypothetical protein
MVIRPSGDAGKARDYSGLPQPGKPAGPGGLRRQPRAAASAWAQAQPLAQAHWKL